MSAAARYRTLNTEAVRLFRLGTRQHDDRRSGTGIARVDDLPVDAAQVLIARGRCIHELKGVGAEATFELQTTVVGLGRHFDDGFPQPKSGSGGQIARGDIEVDEEVVPEKRERLAGGNELRDIAAHHRELGFDIARRAATPAVARHTLFRRQTHPRRRFPHPVRAAAHDPGQETRVLRQHGKPSDARLEIGERTVTSGIPSGTVSFFDESGRRQMDSRASRPWYRRWRGRQPWLSFRWPSSWVSFRPWPARLRPPCPSGRRRTR